MVVRYFNVIRVSIFPTKYNAVLIINGNTPKTFQIVFKLMKSITGRNPQVIQTCSGVKHVQQIPGSLMQWCWDLPGSLGIGPIEHFSSCFTTN
jgi:hypothetical protein